MNKNEFINQVKEGALKGYRDFNILPSVTVAQAILESGWGTSQLAQKANNLFGIKAFSKWQGKRITMPTTEYYEGERQTINADFRAYECFNESIEDHNKLLAYMRYKPVRECKTYKEACIKLYECGYATDPCYSEKLIRLIEENQLYTLDLSLGAGEAAVEFDRDSERILKFQRLCNALSIKDSTGKALVEDNILGWRTLSCLEKMPHLMLGSKGLAVTFVQEVVQANPVDGIFGQITKGCVTKYQRNNGLLADGIVGEQTWSKFLGDETPLS